MSRPMRLIFILDCSGSMRNWESQLHRGYGTLVSSLQENPAPATVDVVGVTSNDRFRSPTYRRLNTPLYELAPAWPYPLDGYTPLVDVLYREIKRVDEVLLHSSEDPIVTFLTITDGKSNDNRHYRADSLANLINQREQQSSWEFLYAGTNHNAYKTAEELGMKPWKALSFATQEFESMFAAMANVINDFRSTEIPPVKGQYFKKEEYERHASHGAPLPRF